jgi:hypothetical protein
MCGSVTVPKGDLHTHFSVSCGGCGHREWLVQQDRSEARKEAMRKGWWRGNNKGWICPKCLVRHGRMR